MTVAEFIAKLQELPPDLIVVTTDGPCDDLVEVSGVDVIDLYPGDARWLNTSSKRAVRI